MKGSANKGYSKRTQKNYSLSFKLQLVEEVEQGLLTKSQAKLKYGIQGDSTVTKWLQKYGTFDWEHKAPMTMAKTLNKRYSSLKQRSSYWKNRKQGQNILPSGQTKKLSSLICW